MLVAERDTEDDLDATAESAPPQAERSEPRTQRSGVSGKSDSVTGPAHHDGSPRDPANSETAIARPFKVDIVAFEFYEQALVLWRDENWNSAQLFREFTKRYGQHAVGRSSFYRWVEERLVEGRAPDPLACNPSLEVGATDAPNPRDLVDLDADPPDFQSRVILDLALRLPADEIELLDAQLSPLKAAEVITLPETVLLRSVRARQAHDRAIERDPIFWSI